MNVYSAILITTETYDSEEAMEHVGIFTTEKKAVDAMIDKLVEFEYIFGYRYPINNKCSLLRWYSFSYVEKMLNEISINHEIDYEQYCKLRDNFNDNVDDNSYKNDKLITLLKKCINDIHDLEIIVKYFHDGNWWNKSKDYNHGKELTQWMYSINKCEIDKPC